MASGACSNMMGHQLNPTQLKGMCSMFHPTPSRSRLAHCQHFINQGKSLLHLVQNFAPDFGWHGHFTLQVKNLENWVDILHFALYEGAKWDSDTWDSVMVPFRGVFINIGDVCV